MKPLPLLLLFLSWGFSSATELMGFRDWTSAEGVALRAVMIRVNGNNITLKREKDGQLFPLPLAKLSEADRALITKEQAEFDTIAKNAVSSGKGSRYFVGLPDPSESVWDLASRLDKHRLLWESITQSRWQASASGNRLLKINPKKMTREQEGKFLIEGENVTVRLIAGEGYKMSINGDKLVLINKSDVKKTIAERGKEFSPSAQKDDLIDCRFEKLGVNEILVFTFNAEWSRY